MARLEGWGTRFNGGPTEGEGGGKEPLEEEKGFRVYFMFEGIPEIRICVQVVC